MQKIYPQENNIPIFNPSGRYWVKLYNFGRAKKIEIDDKMPFDKYEELLTPKTESIKELWPAIFTKAILKLFYHKFQNGNYLYEEIGDLQIIYALTGYQGEKIFLKNPASSNYYNQFSYWASLKRIKAAKKIQNKNKIIFNFQSENNKENIREYKIDEEDSFKDENTNKKLISIIKNISTKENYKEKRKFLLNFSTLNLYTKKDNKFDNIDDMSESFYLKKFPKNSLKTDYESSKNLTIFSKDGEKKSKTIKRSESKLKLSNNSISRSNLFKLIKYFRNKNSKIWIQFFRKHNEFPWKRK